jgi:hypothetical protein
MGNQSQVELLMKWCRLCSAAAPPTSVAMFWIGLRPFVASSPHR